jgi:hypothetical protein
MSTIGVLQSLKYVVETVQDCGSGKCGDDKSDVEPDDGRFAGTAELCSYGTRFFLFMPIELKMLLRESTDSCPMSTNYENKNNELNRPRYHFIYILLAHKEQMLI